MFTTEQAWAKRRQNPAIKQRNVMVLANLALARKIAHRISGTCPEPYDDLEQIAVIGLTKAAERFDPTRGVAFSSFAVPYIQGEIMHFLRDKWDQVKVPRRAIELSSQVKRVQRKMALAGREMDEATIASGLGVAPEKWRWVAEARSRKPLMTLDEVLHPPTTEDESDPELEQMWVREGLAKLSDPYRTCLMERFFGQLSSDAIAKRCQVESSQVESWLTEGLRQLKIELEARGMGECK